MYTQRIFPHISFWSCKARGREEVVKLWENRGWKKIWTRVARSTKFHAPSHCPAYIIGVAGKQATSFGFKYFGRSWSTCIGSFLLSFRSNSKNLSFDRIEKESSNFNQQERSHIFLGMFEHFVIEIELFCSDLSLLN